MLKRISAFLIDFILTILIAAVVSFPAKAIASYKSTESMMNSAFESIASKYGISLDITAEEYNALTDEQQKAWEDAFEEISHDAVATDLYSRYVKLSIALTYICLIAAVLVVEVGFPIFFSNGQTPGKRLLQLEVKTKSGQPIGLASLLVRSLLGKLAIEYGLPVFFFFVLIYGGGNSLAPIGFMALATAQLLCFFLTKDRRVIHDFIASTVVCTTNREIQL